MGDCCRFDDLMQPARMLKIDLKKNNMKVIQKGLNMLFFEVMLDPGIVGMKHKSKQCVKYLMANN